MRLVTNYRKKRIVTHTHTHTHGGKTICYEVTNISLKKLKRKQKSLKQMAMKT